MINDSKDWGDNFQTPEKICEYMASFLPYKAGLILESTAGKGNLVKALEKHGDVFVPDDFYKMTENKFDWVKEQLAKISTNLNKT